MPTVQARNRFPAGLVQPPGYFRFAADALLLAALLEPESTSCSLVDLGCGCGVVGLAMLLRHTDCTVTGVDKEPALTEAAQENARLLGLEDSYTAVTADVAHLFYPDTGHSNTIRPDTGPDPDPAPGLFDMALANPPYYILGHGRLPADPARTKALFGQRETLSIFCRAAVRALRPGGRLGMVFTASRLPELCHELTASGFGAIGIIPVHGREGKEASLVLITATKGSRTASSLAPALVLHCGNSLCHSPQALAFCPELDNIKK